MIKGSVFVWFFILLFAALLPVQAATNFVDFTLVITGLGVILSGYTGIDQLAAIRKTQEMKVGTKFNGNRMKLQWITMAALILSFEGLFLQYYYQPVKGTLPLGELLLMSALTTATFVTTEKAKTASEGTHISNIDGEVLNKASIGPGA